MNEQKSQQGNSNQAFDEDEQLLMLLLENWLTDHQIKFEDPKNSFTEWYKLFIQFEMSLLTQMKQKNKE